MYLQYNGVNLEILQLDRVERDSVYTEDGMDLLYVRWLIGATCVFSPGGYPVGTATKRPPEGGFSTLSTSNVIGVNPVIPPFVQEKNVRGNSRGYNAAVTDMEIRARLWRPRQKLIIEAFDDHPSSRGEKLTFLESPKPGFTCDMAGGPKPISVDIVSSTGEGKTFGVHFQVETFVSPCPSGSDRLLLSHRWEMEHTHDEDNYLTRIIRGTAVFNQEYVQTGIRPDWVRNQIYHPIPLGMKRTLGPIVQSSDGSTIKYEIIDTDTSITFDAGDSGATEISIVENLNYTQPWRFAGRIGGFG